MWWKIYFWIFTLLTCIGLLVYLGYLPWGVSEVLSVFVSVVTVLAAYSYIYKKNVLKQSYWNILWWIMLVLVIESLIEVLFLPKGFIENIIPFWKSKLPMGSGEIIFSWIVSAPSFYALYKLSKKEGNKTPNKKRKSK